jgi:hypothetical protein
MHEQHDSILRRDTERRVAEIAREIPMLTAKEVIAGCASARVDPDDIDYKLRPKLARLMRVCEKERQMAIERFWKNVEKELGASEIIKIYETLPIRVRRDVALFGTRSRDVALLEKSLREQEEMMKIMQTALDANKELVGDNSEEKLRELNEKLAMVYSKMVEK